MKGSQQYRASRPDLFVSLGNGKYGGFKKGVKNGPEHEPPVQPREGADSRDENHLPNNNA